jgi:hypothetical protein
MAAFPEDDTIPRALREALQQVGISSRSAHWDDLPPYRRTPHEVASTLFLARLRELGFTITYEPKLGGRQEKGHICAVGS